MNRIDRLSAILIQLQSKKIITAREIANRFEISLRTVYRDIRALEEAGVPIAAEAGKGYGLVEGYHLPPVMFTREEAGALLAGGKLIEELGDQSLQTGFRDMLFKVKAVLRRADKDFLEVLDTQMTVLNYPQTRPENFPNNFLTRLQDALVHKKVIEIEYFTNYQETINVRKVEPIGVYHSMGSWYLIAYCRLRQAYRNFRADRIRCLKMQEEVFEPRDEKTLKEHISEMMAGFCLQPVRVRFDQKIAKYIVREKYRYGFTQEREVVDNRVEMDFLTFDVSSFGRWLLMFGNEVEIISPDALQKTVQQLVENLHQHYLQKK